MGSNAMASLPTPVAEQFPFMLPTDYGPGLYAPMVLMLVLLMPNSIIYGIFVKVIDKLQRAKYAAANVSYLNAIFGWIE